MAEQDFNALASAWHTDADLSRPIEVVTDMSKSRKLGFLDYQATDESFYNSSPGSARCELYLEWFCADRSSGSKPVHSPLLHGWRFCRSWHSGMSELLAGANMARHEAYRLLVASGFRSEIQGVTMHR